MSHRILRSALGCVCSTKEVKELRVTAHVYTDKQQRALINK